MKYSCFFLVKILISTQILTSIYSKKTGDKCEVQRIFNDVTILGGIKAGLYIPYEGPEGLADMTATKCTGMYHGLPVEIIKERTGTDSCE